MQEQYISEGRAILFIGAGLSFIVGVFILFMVGIVVLLSSTAQDDATTDTVQSNSLGRPLSANAAAIATNNAAPTLDPVQAAVAAENRIETNAANLGYDIETVNLGTSTFAGACSACHGIDALGMPNLGKDLVNSEFVHGLSDADLLTFIKTGRPIWDPANTTGIDMPPKGGNPALTDEQLLAIIAYLRTLGGNPGVVAAAVDTPSTVTSEQSLVVSSPTVVAEVETVVAHDHNVAEAQPLATNDGQQLFIAACSACHGADAHGLPNHGKDLVNSEFVHGLSDADLLTFIKTGRPIWDAANTTGVDMPPKGGNPALTDDQLLAIIAYIRSRN